ncbi:unnamed protein product [Closterium sp. NIES-65]|nr:unnamed protein product [Closterium sp. NIES-65]
MTVEECEENVGKLRKLRFEAENKFDATHAMGEKMKEKMAECEETTAKNAAEREKEKSELMAQVHELENKVKELLKACSQCLLFPLCVPLSPSNAVAQVHELENKVKELLKACSQCLLFPLCVPLSPFNAVAQVHELENKVKELQAKLGISEDSSTSDDTSSDGNTSDK